METLTRYVLPALAVLTAAGALFLQIQGEGGYALMASLACVACICGIAIARSTRLGVLITALSALGANGYLLSRKLAADASPSLCTINSVLDCDKVNTSSYSEAFGLPVTLFGVAFYAGLAFAALSTPRSTPRFHQVNAFFAFFSLGVSAYLAMASVTLGSLCVMCLSIYVSNILLLIAGFKGLRENGSQLFDAVGVLPTSRSFLTISAVFVVILFVGRSSILGASAESIASMTSKGADVGAYVAQFYATPRGTVTLDGTEPRLGSPDAPYTVIEFADFGCPHCAAASKDLKQLVAENPDVQVHFKAFPLSGACNPVLEGVQGTERCLGAVAAECANQQGKFWEMSGNMFRNLGYLDLDALRFMADDEGLDVAAWEACVTNPDAIDPVVADATAGALAGVQGTPTLFLKGTHGDDFVLITYTTADLVKVIEAHRAGVALPAPGPAPLR